MPWRWRKTFAQNTISSTHSLAKHLGVERRANPRIKLPLNAAFATLPSFLFSGQLLKLHDLSLGGCCLLDPKEVLGVSIGQEVVLVLRWPWGDEDLACRIVGRVHDRRHIQFLNMPFERQEKIKALIAPGLAGLHLRQVDLESDHGPVLNAHELWTSVHGESIIFREDHRQTAVIHLQQENLILTTQGWPSLDDGSLASPRQFEGLLLFLANVPNATPKLQSLVSRMIKISSAGTP